MIQMTPEGFEDFMVLIDAPPTVVPEMVRILERPAPWEAGYKPFTDNTTASVTRKTAFLEQLSAKQLIQADAWKRDDLYEDPSS